MGKETLLEREQVGRALQITEREGATGMASVCAIFTLRVRGWLDGWMEKTMRLA